MKYYLMFLFATLGFGLSAQSEVWGTVKDAETGEAVPYANVYLKKYPVGVTAFRDGSFVLKFDTLYQDSLIVSCIGFVPYAFYLPDMQGQGEIVVKLQPSREILEEAQVLPKKLITVVEGLPKRRARYCGGSPVSHPYARYIPNDGQGQGFIKSVSVYVCKEGIYDAPFRLNLLKANLVEGAPAGPLLPKDFILRSSKGNEWVTVDLEEELIPIPVNGFFVGVEALPIDSLQMHGYKQRLPDLSEGWIKVSAPKFGMHREKFAVAAKYNWSFNWNRKGWRPYWMDFLKENDPSMTRFATASSLLIKAEIDFYDDGHLPHTKALKPKRELKKVFDVPKVDLKKYPQLSVKELMVSLQKAIQNEDYAYVFNHLVYYRDEEELQETLMILQETGGSVLSAEDKQKVLALLSEIENSLEDLKPPDAGGFQYRLKYKSQIYYFQSKEGLWKISPGSTNLVKLEDFGKTIKLKKATH